MNERVELIRSTLQEALSPVVLEIADDSAAHAGHAGGIQSGGGHYSVYLIADCFAGKNPVQRHQMVYRALGELMRTDIHALIIKAFTPSELN